MYKLFSVKNIRRIQKEIKCMETTCNQEEPEVENKSKLNSRGNKAQFNKKKTIQTRNNVKYTSKL